MNRTLSLPVQELIRATERVLVFANHKGLPQEDFEAVLSCAHDSDMTSNRAARLLDRPLRASSLSSLLSPLSVRS